MVPVLFSSSTSSASASPVLSLPAMVASFGGGQFALSSGLGALGTMPAPLSPRGRKRTNESLDGHVFAKRHSNSDLSDEDDNTSSPLKEDGSPGILVDDERRAHHNELERRRRDHIKDHFMCLKDAIPLLEGEKSSRALILKRAVEYINLLHTRLREYQASMEEMARKENGASDKAPVLPRQSSPIIAAPIATVPSPTPITPPLLVVPTTSAAPSLTLDSLPKPVVVSSPSTSPFSPVIRAPAPLPTPSTMTELAMLLAINAAKQNQENQLDLASLLSLQSLKEATAPATMPQFVSPLLF